MGEGVEPEKVVTELLYSLGFYQSIIEILIEHEPTDGICYVSQTEIANRLRSSQINISKRLKKLEDTDQCVKKVAP